MRTYLETIHPWTQISKEGLQQLGVIYITHRIGNIMSRKQTSYRQQGTRSIDKIASQEAQDRGPLPGGIPSQEESDSFSVLQAPGVTLIRPPTNQHMQMSYRRIDLTRTITSTMTILSVQTQ